jgi:ATP-dependent DNA helicase HFM1/MER3
MFTTIPALGRSRYQKVMSGKDLIESNLHQHLAEHLNSEVVLRTITDIGYAMEWIRSTYLYVRALQNPSHYGIPSNLNRKGIEGKLQEMCQRELNALASAKLLTIDHRMDVHPTKDGALMARFYLNLGTMKSFHRVCMTFLTSTLRLSPNVVCFLLGYPQVLVV